MLQPVGNRYSIETSDDLKDVVENILDEIASLANSSVENIEESTHLIRKRLKFLRAVVKLTMDCSDRDDYKESNLLLRDCGREISKCRDAHVRNHLLKEILQNESSIAFRPLLEELISLNQYETNTIEEALLSGKNVYREISSTLSNNSEIISYFSNLEPDFESFFKGYSACYGKSYIAFHSGMSSHDSESLHEWRKRTKDLQNQYEVLMHSIPGDLPPDYTELVELCEILGRINDLFMLSDWISGHKKSIIHSNRFGDLSGEINREINSQQNHAEEHGNNLYRLTPDEYSENLEHALE